MNPRPADLGSLYRLQGIVLAVSFAVAASVAPEAAPTLAARMLAAIEREAGALSPHLRALRVAVANLPQPMQSR